MSDTMCRLYLELSQVVPDGTKTERELKLEARVAELEAKIVEIRDAWYFTDDALADQSLATVACMCGTKIQFVEPSSLGSRKVNCRCGRRWLWRWADKN